MSLLKAIKAQLGLSNTPANNFTITAEADNGTLKLARGNAGATTQDILTVDVNGNVLVGGNNLNLFSAKSLVSNGYQKLPSGLIIQWGSISITSVSGASSMAIATFPIAFTSFRIGVLKIRSAANSIQYAAYDNDGSLKTGVQINLVATSGAGGIPVPVEYIFIGV